MFLLLRFLLVYKFEVLTVGTMGIHKFATIGLLLTLALPCVGAFSTAKAPPVTRPNAKPAPWVRGGAAASSAAPVDGELKDFSGSVSGIFNSVRLASLFPTGAILGAAFAMPLAAADNLSVGMAKRFYLLLAIASLGSGLLAGIYSSVAINKINLDPPLKAASAQALLERDFEFLWVGTNFHYYASLVGFVGLVGLRSWSTFGCPHFGTTGAVTIASVVALMVSAIADERGLYAGAGLKLPLRYATLLLKRARQGSVLTVIGVALGIYGAVRTGIGAQHAHNFIMKSKGA